MRFTEGEKLCYLAGIIDGEGSVILSPVERRKKSGYHLVRVSFANTDKGIIEFCKEILDGMFVNYCERILDNKYNKLGKKEVTLIEVGRQAEAEFLLSKLLPYLKSEKRNKAMEVLIWINNRKRLDGKKSNRRKRKGGG